MKSNYKLVSLSFLLCGFIAALLFKEMFATLWAVLHLQDPAWILAPYDLIGIAFGIITFVTLSKLNITKTFMIDVITELEKVTWPNRKETTISTGVVSILVGICAMILFGFDLIWGSLVSLFYQ